jgi:hypothetical protein
MRLLQTPGPDQAVTASFSTRTFILGPDDTLYRLANAKFLRIVDDPESRRVKRFSVQRVRMVGVIVELHERRPRPVIRLVYQMLGIDDEGRLDSAAFIRQGAALTELAVDRVSGQSARPGETIVDASSRFVSQGGRWQPSPSLEQEILRPTLDELKCERFLRCCPA